MFISSSYSSEELKRYNDRTRCFDRPLVKKLIVSALSATVKQCNTGELNDIATHISQFQSLLYVTQLETLKTPIFVGLVVVIRGLSLWMFN